MYYIKLLHGKVNLQNKQFLGNRLGNLYMPTFS